MVHLLTFCILNPVRGLPKMGSGRKRERANQRRAPRGRVAAVVAIARARVQERYLAGSSLARIYGRT
jgi:hypothetical protein